jgi:hypothetical protein
MSTPVHSPALSRHAGHNPSGDFVESGFWQPGQFLIGFIMVLSPLHPYITDWTQKVTGEAKESSLPGQHAKEMAQFLIHLRR